MPNILDEFDYQPDRTADYGVRALECIKYLHVLIMGQMVSPDFLGCFLVQSFYYFLEIIIIISIFKDDNENMHESLGDFEFSPDQATDYGVSCPLSV